MNESFSVVCVRRMKRAETEGKCCFWHCELDVIPKYLTNNSLVGEMQLMAALVVLTTTWFRVVNWLSLLFWWPSQLQWDGMEHMHMFCVAFSRTSLNITLESWCQLCCQQHDLTNTLTISLPYFNVFVSLQLNSLWHKNPRKNHCKTWFSTIAAGNYPWYICIC